MTRRIALYVAVAATVVLTIVMVHQGDAYAAQSTAPGLDVVFLLENRSNAWLYAQGQQEDFDSLDPQNSRYDALQLTAQFLALDSLLFNPENENWLSAIVFDNQIRAGGEGQSIYTDGMDIRADSEADLKRLNEDFKRLLRPVELPDLCKPGDANRHDEKRCGAAFDKAFLEAQKRLEARARPGRKQIMIMFTVYGGSGPTRYFDSAEHNKDMVAVRNVVSALAGRGVPLYGYALHSVNPSYESPTDNRTWDRQTSKDWRGLGNGSEVDILARPQDFLPKVRNILRRTINLDRISARDIDLNAGTEFNVSPFVSSFTAIYLKDEQGDSIDLVYSNPNDPGYIPKPDRLSSGFFEVLTVADPPPGAYWQFSLANRRGQITLLETPGASTLALVDESTNNPVNQLDMYHQARIVFTPTGFNGTALLYEDRAFDLKPIAVVEAGGKQWELPLSLQRIQGTGRGQYTANFHPVVSGNHHIALRYGNGASSKGKLIDPPQYDFAAGEIRYVFEGKTPTQFEPWNYTIAFENERGERVSPSNFVQLPGARMALASDSSGELALSTQEQPAYLRAEGVYSASYTFRYHGRHVLGLTVRIPDANGVPASVPSKANTDTYAIEVVPAPLVIDIQDSAREYDDIKVRFKPEKLNFEAFKNAYNLNIDAVLTLDAPESKPFRVRLEPQSDGPDAGFYAGTFYATREGKYRVNVEGYMERAGNRDVLITADQGQKIFTATTITIGLLDVKPAVQFSAWTFTVALLENGEPLKRPLSEALKPEVTIKLGDAQVPFNQLQAVPDKIGQWTGTHTFTTSGDVVANIAALGQPPKALGSSSEPVVIDPAEPQGKSIPVAPVEVIFKSNLAEQLMLDPVEFTLDVPRIGTENGNKVLREKYNVEVTFVVTASDDMGIVQTWRVPANKVEDPGAPFVAQFIPTVEKEHTVKAEYRGSIPGGGKITLQTGAPKFNARPLTVSLEPQAGGDWAFESGTYKVEIERKLTLVAKFFDGDNIQTRTPALKTITVQAALVPPGAIDPRHLEFKRNEADNTYTLETETLTIPGEYVLDLIAQVKDQDGRDRRLPPDQRIATGFRFTVIAIQEIKFALASSTPRQQAVNRLPVFNQDEVVLDLETFLVGLNGGETPTDPKKLFTNANPDDAESWFILTINGEEIPKDRMTISFPEQELLNGFRLRVRGLPLGEHNIELRIAEGMNPHFGARVTPRSVFSGEKITLNQSVLQPILFGIAALALVAGVVKIGLDRARFQREYAVQIGALVLEDEYQRVLWRQSLTDVRRATQNYTKMDEKATGWGRAMLETILVENTKTLAADHKLKITVTQTGGKPQEIYMHLAHPEERYQLSGARKGFYLRLVNNQRGEIP